MTSDQVAAPLAGVRVPKRDEPMSDELFVHVRRAVQAGHIGLVSIFCDVCGYTESMDCTGEAPAIRFEAARRYLGGRGWRCGERVDVCPRCTEVI